MKFGTWVHHYDDISLDSQIALAAESGLQTLRSYHIAYAEQAAPALKQAGMSLFADMWVDAAALAKNWRSQIQLEELARYHELGVPLAAICVGNELREGGDAPGDKQFSARLSFGLANLIATYRQWMDAHGYTTPLTYAMEGIVFDREGYFNEWVWPLIDACDIVSVNSYPMDDHGWFTFDAFEESRRFLCDTRARNDRLALFEVRLRRILQQLERIGKPLTISETGFPSAVGYHMTDDHLIVPHSDNARYGGAMGEFVTLIRRVNADYGDRVQAVYFYEWRDNLYHHKIWNEEQSPIHVAFGLCDRFGVPKLAIKELVDQ